MSVAEDGTAAVPMDLSSNRLIREQARMLLKGKWNGTAVAMLVLLVVCILPSVIPKIGSLIGVIIGGPLALGAASYFLRVSNQQEATLQHLFSGFESFVRSLIGYLLVCLFVFLWMLLLIVPGIIAALSYSLTFYLMVDNPDMAPRAAIKRSKELMAGHKMDLFLLGLSFIGWGILAMLTLGIGYLWLIPYVNTSMALFYKKVILASGSQVVGNSQ